MQTARLPSLVHTDADGRFELTNRDSDRGALSVCLGGDDLQLEVSASEPIPLPPGDYELCWRHRDAG